jgi:hypothetical protein
MILFESQESLFSDFFYGTRSKCMTEKVFGFVISSLFDSKEDSVEKSLCEYKLARFLHSILN